MGSNYCGEQNHVSERSGGSIKENSTRVKKKNQTTQRVSLEYSAIFMGLILWSCESEEVATR